MIQKIRSVSAGLIARFGGGTVKVRAYVLKTRTGGQVEFTQCRKTTIGDEPDEVLHSNKIVLDFTSLESLDVVIDRLQGLRDDMANEVVG
jgi:hypothetical protein